MLCYLIVHPGEGYSTYWKGEDVEEHSSIRAALQSFDRFPDPYYPCAYDDTREDGGPEGWLFFYDPRDPENPEGDVVDVYPDRIVSYGPRGGIQQEAC